MERDILDRLKSLIDDDLIEPAMFFKVCALMGVSFAAAIAVASSSPAFASTLAAASPVPSSYADFVSPDVIAYTDAVRAADSTNANRPFFGKISGEPYHAFDNFFVKKSGEPYHAFDNFSKSR
jgi:hypothetical protein